MVIPKDPNVFAWKTRTINVCGDAEETNFFTSTLDKKLKGKFFIHYNSTRFETTSNIGLTRSIRPSYWSINALTNNNLQYAS